MKLQTPARRWLPLASGSAALPRLLLLALLFVGPTVAAFALNLQDNQPLLVAARESFAQEVGPLPAANSTPSPSGKREAEFIHCLGGDAPLVDDDLAAFVPVLRKSPAAWTTDDVAMARHFLAKQAPLLAAARRATASRLSTKAAVVEPWASASDGALWRRARLQAAVLRTEISLALREKSLEVVVPDIEALAAEVESFQAEGGALLAIDSLSLEKGLLQTLVWIAADSDIGPADLAAIRRSLPAMSQEAGVKRMIAGEAAYFLTRAGPELAMSDDEKARRLDNYRRLARDLMRPQGWSEAALSTTDTGSVSSIADAMMRQLTPNFASVASRVAAVEAARQLAELALDLRLAATTDCAYPTSLERWPLANQPDSYAGQLPLYQRKPGGGALLTNSRAAAAWAANEPQVPGVTSPPFTWHLPPAAVPNAPGCRPLGAAPSEPR